MWFLCVLIFAFKALQPTAAIHMMKYPADIQNTTKCVVVSDKYPSWKKAILGCSKVEKCAMAYKQDSSYYHCLFDSISEIKLLEESWPRYREVAFKTTKKGVCPKSLDHFEGFITDFLKYHLSVSPRGIAHVDYYRRYKCPKGWIFSRRVGKPWCLKIIGGPNKLYTWSEAAKSCQKINGVLSGIENSNEALWIAEHAKRLSGLSDSPKDLISVWISGKRSNYTNVPGASVKRRVSQYRFTDPNLHLDSWINRDSVWSPGQPSPDENPACIQMRVSKSGNVKEHLKLDNWKCDVPKARSDDLWARAAVCGRFAKPWGW